jgi:hypothetical protein
MSAPPPARFSFAPDPLRAILDAAASDGSQGDDRFVPRNFLLDEGVSAERTQRYAEYVHTEGADDYASWSRAHVAFVTANIECEPPPGGLPTVVEPRERLCPETFRIDPLLRAFGQLAPELDLVAIAPIAPIARAAGVTAAMLREAITDDPPLLDAALDAWEEQQQVRPVFAAIWEDVRDLVPGSDSEPPDGWADRLRDRLGLSHLDPSRRSSVDVIVLRYAAGEVPRVRGMRGDLALVVPTVLDTRFFPPFCPAPMTSECGRIVDLTGDLDEPVRELLHLPVRFRARHVLRAGVIRTPPPKLADARLAHLLYVQAELARPDFGRHTDQDLLC